MLILLDAQYVSAMSNNFNKKPCWYLSSNGTTIYGTCNPYTWQGTTCTFVNKNMKKVTICKLCSQTGIAQILQDLLIFDMNLPFSWYGILFVAAGACTSIRYCASTRAIMVYMYMYITQCNIYEDAHLLQHNMFLLLLCTPDQHTCTYYIDRLMQMETNISRILIYPFINQYVYESNIISLRICKCKPMLEQ